MCRETSSDFKYQDDSFAPCMWSDREIATKNFSTQFTLSSIVRFSTDESNDTLGWMLSICFVDGGWLERRNRLYIFRAQYNYLHID
jgi:hypothetical protein